MNYREEVLKTMNSEANKDLLLMGVLGLVGESGEVADLIKKNRFQGHTLHTQQLIKELGDVRWYLEVLCIALGTTITDVEAKNVEKLRARYPNGFTSQLSVVRKEGDT